MKRSSATRRLLIVVFLVLTVLVLATPRLLAAEMRSGDVVTVEQGTTVNDSLYISAGTITIDGTVNGDVFAAGGEITVNGEVTGNLIVGGQTVIIHGTVRDVIVGAQSVLLGTGAHVTGNVTSGSNVFESREGSAIDGDLVVFGNQVLLAGEVGRDVVGGMSGLEIRGTVGRNVTVGVGGISFSSMQSMFSITRDVGDALPTGGLTLTDSAEIGGKLEYTSPDEARIAPGATVTGGVTWEEAPAQESATPTVASSVFSVVRRFVTLLLIGLLLVWLVPRWVRQMGETIQAKPLPSLGFGLLFLILFMLLLMLIPTVGILLALTFGLLTLGGVAWFLGFLAVLLVMILVAGFLLFVAYVAQVIISFLIGRWLLQRFQPSYAEGRVLPLVLGLALFVIVAAIPFLGWLVSLAAILLGLGTLWYWLRSGRAPTTVTASPLPGIPN